MRCVHTTTDGIEKPLASRTCAPGSCPTFMRVALLPILLAITLPLQAAGPLRYERGGQVLEIELNDRVAKGQRDDIIAWVRGTANALALVYGRWPQDRWRVRVTTLTGAGRDPVPWAQVQRGDPDQVAFYVDPGASLARLENDWTAYHEFSHLLIPYRGWGDMWFSEGLASYYQNILQARHGVFDEREMWQRLYEGFMRGRDNRRPDLSLAELSPRMRENRSFMRVYWSGAWYFFRADTELRRRSRGEQSLDSALAALYDCCAGTALSARQIAGRLDRLTGQALFLPLFDEVSRSRALPDFEQPFSALGIEVKSGVVSLDDSHAMAGLRRAIASP